MYSLFRSQDIKQSLIIVILSLFLAGCESAPSGSTPAGTDHQRVQRPKSIDKLLIQAEQSDQQTADSLRAKAAAVAVSKGELAKAEKILTLVVNPYSSPDTTTDYLFSKIEILLAKNLPGEALEHLNDDRLQAIALSQPLQIRIGRLRAQAYRQMRSYVASARQLIYIDPLLTGDELQKNHELIFSSLTQLPANTLVNQANNAITSDLRGWLSLAAMTRQYQNNPTRQLQELSNWQKVWSSHAAAQNLPSSLQMLSEVVAKRAKTIALLLPTQGDLGSFGRAIRDGALAANYLQQNPTTILIYNSAVPNIEAQVQLAIGAGAELIIGPLQRDNVRRVKQMNLEVPVIALNHSNDSTMNPQLYQFGLAPEDEMRQVADQVAAQGYAKGLVIAPSGEWGDRNLQTFIERWQPLGGVVVGELRYSDQKDYSEVIKTLLKVDQSELRSKQLRRIIGERFEFSARRRQDFDFIFLLANPIQARGIKPTLAFFYADDVPVYATSHVHRMSESKIDAIDLNGIRFCDIPWKLTNSNDLQREIVNLFPSASTNLASFYALGVDAFQLYPRLQQLSSSKDQRMYGATGALTISDNTIHRELMWAQFKEGGVITMPIVMPTTNTLSHR